MPTIEFIGNKPAQAHKTDAGFDLVSNVNATIPVGRRSLIPTGTSVNIPAGYEGQVRSRSGIAHKNGVAVLNSPGTVDAGYIGEIFVNLINHGDKPFHIKRGDRIAQLVIARVAEADFVEVSVLSPTERGDGGHGSTGM